MMQLIQRVMNPQNLEERVRVNAIVRRVMLENVNRAQIPIILMKAQRTMNLLNRDAKIETEEKGINEKIRVILTVKRKRKRIIPMMKMRTMTLMMAIELDRNPKDGENEMNQRLRPKIIKSFSASISKQKRTLRMQSVTPKEYGLSWRISSKLERRKMCLRSK